MDISQSDANKLGYDNIRWDVDNQCYSGYGACDPMDRSRDDGEGYYVADTLSDVRLLLPR